jgi:hypothetical protein
MDIETKVIMTLPTTLSFYIGFKIILQNHKKLHNICQPNTKPWDCLHGNCLNLFHFNYF